MFLGLIALHSSSHLLQIYNHLKGCQQSIKGGSVPNPSSTYTGTSVEYVNLMLTCEPALHL